MKNLNIRKDIQSLRGLSVILIFLFHFDQVFFKYLYVGVDIFFVISGYVITSSIFNSIKKNEFDLYLYFLRRIKRIYPGLIFFLIFFNIIFFLFFNFNDGEYFEIIFSSISSFLGISNFYYSLSPNLDYFDDKLKWLQHTWSLSNEIQFYILIGVIFYVISKFTDIKQKKNTLVIVLIVISIISIFFFLFSNNQMLSNYYASFSRFWEFFLGSLAYLLKFEKFKIKNVSFDFFVLIFISVLLIVNFLIPNINYRLIILFSVLFITFVIFFSDKNNLSKINNFFIFYGNISFSFFLWHLPVISFLKIYNQINYFGFILCFLITTIISYFSYSYIEIKFNKRFQIDNKLKETLKYTSFLLIFCCCVIFLNKKYLENFRDITFQKIIKFYPVVKNINNSKVKDKDNNNWILSFDKCSNNHENFSWSERVNCIVDNGNKKILFITGNSYADHIVPAFSSFKSETAVYKSRFENCYLNYDFSCNNKSKKIINSFKKISEGYDKKFFIISINTRNISFEKLKTIFDQLPIRTNIIFIYSHPNVKTFNNKDLLNKYNEIKEEDFKNFDVLTKTFNLTIFDTYSILCREVKCDKYNYQSLFTDGSHFKISTNQIISNKLKEIIF